MLEMAEVKTGQDIKRELVKRTHLLEITEIEIGEDMKRSGLVREAYKLEMLEIRTG